MPNDRVPPWRSQKVWVLSLGVLVLLGIFIIVAVSGGDIMTLVDKLADPITVLFSVFLGARAVEGAARSLKK